MKTLGKRLGAIVALIMVSTIMMSLTAWGAEDFIANMFINNNIIMVGEQVEARIYLRTYNPEDKQLIVDRLEVNIEAEGLEADDFNVTVNDSTDNEYSYNENSGKLIIEGLDEISELEDLEIKFNFPSKAVGEIKLSAIAYGEVDSQENNVEINRGRITVVDVVTDTVDVLNNKIQAVIDAGGGTVDLDFLGESYLMPNNSLNFEIDKDMEITFRSTEGIKLLKPDESGNHFYFHLDNYETNFNLSFENVVLDGANGGGGIYLSRGTTTINNAVIQNCNTRYGAVEVFGNLIVNNSVFKNNDSLSYGGAIYVYTGDAIITGCIFENNTGNSGGAVNASEDILITDSIFKSNIADYGGAAYAEKNIVVTDSVFINNSADEKGSTLYAEDGTIKMNLSQGGIFIAQTLKDNNFSSKGSWSQKTSIELNGTPGLFYIESAGNSFGDETVNNKLVGKAYGDLEDSIFAVIGTPELTYNGSSQVKPTDKDIKLNVKGLADMGDLGSVELTLRYKVDGGTEKTVKLSESKEIDVSSYITGEGSYVFSLLQTISYNGQTYESDLSNTVTIVSKADTTDGEKPSGGGGGGGGSVSQVTVTFNTNGGSSISSAKVTKDSKVSEPTAPTREGYKFLGWYTDKELTKEYDFSQTVKESFTLYAKWEKTNETVKPEEEKPDTTNPQAEEKTGGKAYVSGFPDGTFRPDSTITRGEGAQMIYGLALQNGQAMNSGGKNFGDVNADDWFYNAVSALSAQGIISGYEDGTFQPSKALTRGEFLVMVLSFGGFEAGNVPANLSDVNDSHWAAGWIGTAIEKGLVSGYPDGTFRPDSTITRAEGITIINSVIGRSGLSGGTSFSDVPQGHWAYEAITAAATN